MKSCIKCSLTKQPKAYGKAPLKQITFHRFNDCIVVDHDFEIMVDPKGIPIEPTFRLGL